MTPPVLVLVLALLAAAPPEGQPPPPPGQPEVPPPRAEGAPVPAPPGASPTLPGAGPLASQVGGQVLDARGKGVAGLPVAAIPQSGGWLYGTTTDEAGRYTFKGLQTNTYGIVVVLPTASLLRKDAVRVRPLFRSIVDFRTPDALPASATSVPPVIASEQPSELSVICAVMASDRTPVPDALVTMTPMAMDGSINGALRLARSGLDGLARMPTMPSASYRIAVRVPGMITWSLGPVELRGSGTLALRLSMTAFPLGFEGTIEDLLIPIDPIPPAGLPR